MSTITDETTEKTDEQEQEQETTEDQKDQTDEKQTDEDESDEDDEARFSREKTEAEDRIADKVAKKLQPAPPKDRKPDRRPKPQHFSERRLWGKDKR